MAALALAANAAASAQVAMDPVNPTCPAHPNWSNIREMRLTIQEIDGRRVLLGVGLIDDNLLPRLRDAIYQNPDVGEIWLRSAGGNAVVGNQAGTMLRNAGFATRIPSGSACLGACAFMFMGGFARAVDEGGYLILPVDPPFDYPEEFSPEERRQLQREIGQAAAQMASETLDYLIRMGISRTLMDMLFRPSQDGSRRRCLTAEELARYNIVPRTLTGNRQRADSGGK